MSDPPHRQLFTGFPMSGKGAGILLLALGLLTLAGAAFVNYEALAEAYGSGPPYYSRTTNMDNWSDPAPELLIGDVVALFVSGILIRVGLRKLSCLH